MRKHQNTNTLLTLIELLSSGSQLMSEQRLEDLVVGYALGRISNIRKAQEIFKVSQLIQQINQAYYDNTISRQSRISILLKVTGVNYDNYDVFQRSLIRYVQEETESSQTKNRHMQKVDESDYQHSNSQQIKGKRNLEQQKLSQQYISKLISMQENKQRQRRKQELQNQKYAQWVANKYQKELQSQKKKMQSPQTNCQICLENILIKDLACLKCLDSYHRQCLATHFQVSIESRNLPLRCPSCNKQCCLTDIRQYLNDVIYQKYQQITFQSFVDNNNKDMSWCPTPGCKYIFFFEGQQTKFDCPMCLKQYCLKCKTPFHKGMTCKQSSINNSTGQDHQKFIEFVQGAKYKQCSNCLFWVEKTQGCNHMTCRCKHQFCYNCGGKYKQCGCPRAGLFGNPIINEPRPAISAIPRPRVEENLSRNRNPFVVNSNSSHNPFGSSNLPVSQNNPFRPSNLPTSLNNPFKKIEIVPPIRSTSLFSQVEPIKTSNSLFPPINQQKIPTSLFGQYAPKPSNILLSLFGSQKPDPPAGNILNRPQPLFSSQQSSSTFLSNNLFSNNKPF